MKLLALAVAGGLLLAPAAHAQLVVTTNAYGPFGPDGIINGAGTTTTDRPDVVRSIPTITTPHVSYEVITTVTTGQQRVYGFDQENHTVYSFGVGAVTL